MQPTVWSTLIFADIWFFHRLAKCCQGLETQLQGLEGQQGWPSAVRGLESQLQGLEGQQGDLEEKRV